MNSPKAPETRPSTLSAVAALEQDARWAHANEAEQAVLRRIAMQRDRLLARRTAHQQAIALQQRAEAVSPEAPLVARLMTFVRLHPVAAASIAGAVLVVGPRKVLRLGMTLLPLLANLRKASKLMP